MKSVRGVWRLRRDAGISFAELADMTGIAATTLCKAENGQIQLSGADLYLLRRLLILRIAERADELNQVVEAHA